MKDRQMKRETLAYKTGFSIASIDGWLKGKNTMTIFAALAICDVLSISFNDLLEIPRASIKLLKSMEQSAYFGDGK
jgi:DNA-binding Xre family transcriptional regulator